MAELEIRVPDIGDFDVVDVIDVLVKPGDRVALEEIGRAHVWTPVTIRYGMPYCA